jgi:cyclopropane fatty-acyl-phospholipid synthase-like methyltransferase
LAGWLAERRMTGDRIDTVRETVKFLRKSATELRQAATNEPDLAQTLRHMADQCEATAKELAEHYGID